MKQRVKMKTTSVNCPNQIEGKTADGRMFYFRGRGGGWTLSFGATIDEAIAAVPAAEGEDPDAGWWSPRQAKAFCLKLLRILGAA